MNGRYTRCIRIHGVTYSRDQFFANLIKSRNSQKLGFHENIRSSRKLSRLQ
ncbi:unnamed protein product [Ixodes persulcatus]